MSAGRFAKSVVCLALFATLAISATASATEVKFKTGGQTFTSTSGKGTLQLMNAKAENGNKVTCEKDKNTGKIVTVAGTLPEVQGLVVTFEECSAVVGGLKFACPNIVTNSLTGLTGNLGKTTKKEAEESNTKKEHPGLKLLPPASGEFAKFECVGQKFVVTGALLGELSPKETETTKFELKLGAASPLTTAQHQAFQSWFMNGVSEEGLSLKTSVNGGAAEPSSIVTTDTVTTSANNKVEV
jgi:hypothetical protein